MFTRKKGIPFVSHWLEIIRCEQYFINQLESSQLKELHYHFSFVGMNLDLPCLDYCKETIDEEVDHYPKKESREHNVKHKMLPCLR